MMTKKGSIEQRQRLASARGGQEHATKMPRAMNLALVGNTPGTAGSCYICEQPRR